MTGNRAYRLHVANKSAHVLGRDVVAAKARDSISERSEKGGSVKLAGRAHDNCLAATERQASQRVLIGHAFRKPHRVRYGVRLVVV